MIQIMPQIRMLLSVKPVDFRKGIDGLAGICRRILKAGSGLRGLTSAITDVILAYISLIMEMHRRLNPAGKLHKNLPFFKELADEYYTQKD